MRRTLAFIAAATVLAGCAGLFGGGAPAARPALEPGKGRVFVYRGAALAGAFPPEVLLNGENLGRADKRGAAWRDVLPGSYTVATTLNATVVHFNVAAGETRYVRLVSGFFDERVRPEIVDAAKGASDVADMPPLSPPKGRR